MSKPDIAWGVYVDWNNDGDFADASEDVSGDVLGFSCTRGRNSTTEDFGAGTATLELLNTSGDYSPANTGGSLYGSILPGRQVKVVAVHDTVNLIENPSFETDVNAVTVPASLTKAVDATTFVYGSQCMKISYNSFSASDAVNFTQQGGALLPATPGEWYCFSLWIKPNGTPFLGHIGMRWYSDSGSTLISHTWGLQYTPSNPINLVGTEGWQRFWYAAQAPAGTVTVKPNWEEMGLTFGTGESFFIDGVMFSQRSVLTDYIDGAQTGCVWNGTAHASSSTGSLTYPVFRGYIAEIQESRTPDGRPSVLLHLTDGASRLARSLIRTESFVDDSIDTVLDTLVADYTNWDVALTDFEASEYTLPYFWTQEMPAMDAFRLAAKQELGGQFFVSRDGKLTFKSRYSRSSEPMLAQLTGPEALSITWREDDMISDVDFQAGEFTASSRLAWALEEPILLHPGLNIVRGEFTTGVVGALLASGTYSVNTASDGSGLDKTSSTTFDYTNHYGEGFEYGIVNNEPDDLYLIGMTFTSLGGTLQRRTGGDHITLNNPSAAVTDQTLQRTFEFNADRDAITDYGYVKLAAGQTLQPRVTVKPQIADDVDAVVALSGELGKRVYVANTTGLYPTQLADYFYIENIKVDAVLGRFMSVEWGMFQQDIAEGNYFRISGASGTGQDYSLIEAAASTTGARLGFT